VGGHLHQGKSHEGGDVLLRQGGDCGGAGAPSPHRPRNVNTYVAKKRGMCKEGIVRHNYSINKNNEMQQEIAKKKRSWKMRN